MGMNWILLFVNGIYDFECGLIINISVCGKEVVFLINFFYVGMCLLIKCDLGIKNYMDLVGKIVVSIVGSMNEKVFKKFVVDYNIDVQIIFGKDYVDGLKLVEIGCVLVLVFDDVLLYGLCVNFVNLVVFEVVVEILQVELYVCMVCKDDFVFKWFVDVIIKCLMKFGEFIVLYKKWFELFILLVGVNFDMLMSDVLCVNLKKCSDKLVF